MRWRTAGLCAVSLLGLMGCPETYGKDGSIDDAVEKDMKERVLGEESTCPPPAQVKEICGDRPRHNCYPDCDR